MTCAGSCRWCCLIALLLAVLLRSLVAPLYLIASVGLSYLASLGLAIIVFMGIGGRRPELRASLLHVHLPDGAGLGLQHPRHDAYPRGGPGLPLAEAVRRAVAATGSTVTSAGLVLAGTFAVLTVAGDTQTQEIGLGLAAGILLDTFLVRTLLIPGGRAGRWNWWPCGCPRRPGGRAPGRRLTSGAAAGHVQAHVVEHDRLVQPLQHRGPRTASRSGSGSGSRWRTRQTVVMNARGSASSVGLSSSHVCNVGEPGLRAAARRSPRRSRSSTACASQRSTARTAARPATSSDSVRKRSMLPRPPHWASNRPPGFSARCSAANNAS